MNKNIIMVMFFIISSFVLYYIFSSSKKVIQNKIVILQTARHPALDRMKDMIIEVITPYCQENRYNIECKNGDGNIMNLELLAEEAMNNAVTKKIIAIGSPALQSAINAGLKYKKEIPIIFGAVTYPEICRVGMYPYVKGISDQLNFSAVINELTSVAEGKKIGFLYSVGDEGSRYTLEKLSYSNEYEMIPFGCTTEGEVMQMVDSACQKVDLLFIPPDNMIAGAIKTIRAIVKKYNKKLFMTDKVLFDRQSDYFCGIDYASHGRALGEIVKE